MEKITDINTLTNHVTIPELPEGNYPLNPPIYQAVKFSWENYDDLKAMMRGEKQGYFYTRYANPTVHALESLLANIQGRESCVVTASGLAAVTTCFLALLQQGDHVILFIESYRPSRVFAREWLPRYGIDYSLLSISDMAGLKKAIIPGKTKMILFESPTNPQLKIADVAQITALARQHGAATVMDNTFASFHNHGTFDVDLYLHSLTKYASGHGDAMGGAIIGSGPWIAKVKSAALAMGSNLDPNSAYLLLRGMKTFQLRYQRQSENAQRLAEWLQRQPQVKRVIYPGLSSHPQHALARQQMRDFGTMIMMEIKGSGLDLETLIKKLRIFKLAASLGSTESMIAPVMMFYGSDLSPNELQQADFNESCLRISVGIEDPTVLIADFSQALTTLPT